MGRHPQHLPIGGGVIITLSHRSARDKSHLEEREERKCNYKDVEEGLGNESKEKDSYLSGKFTHYLHRFFIYFNFINSEAKC